MRLAHGIGLGCVVACALGCAPAPAVVPQIPVGGDPSARQGAYERYKLTGDIGAFTASWQRADGKYQWPQLEPLAQQYAETKDVYGRAQTRGIVLSIIGGVGGGLVGYTLGWNLAAREDQRMSSGTQVALYATGGGLIVVALVVGLAWHNPAEDFADAYNTALRRELGLPEPLPKAGAASLVWVPRPLESGYGWRF